jgi:hypothetical protein
MKRFWFVLLSLGLVLVFSASAFAVDVKFSGSFYASGMYQDKTSFIKNGYYFPPVGEPVFSNGDPSTAFYYQRLRLQTDFIVSPGLKLITRFDAMKRAWGAPRSASDIALDRQSAGTTAENEIIAFDWAYIEYTSPIGMFTVGYQDDGGWGTVFGDSSLPHGIVSWVVQQGGWTGFLQIVKIGEYSKTAKHSTNVVDNDTDKYQIGAMYEWKTGQVGLLGIYYRDASSRGNINPTPPPVDGGMIGNIYVLQPYAIVQIGPVKIQAEVDYAWGSIKSDILGIQDIRVDNLAGWVDATVDFKMFYFGGSAAYVAGNDWTKTDVIKGGFLTGGMDWNPTLLLFNNEREYWAGAIPGNNVTSTSMNFVSQNFGLNDTGMYNAWFFQGRVGVRPIDKLDIVASVSYAMADSKTLPAPFPDTVSNVYGTEIDLIGTYKITNNLSYMLGFGYLFTGDYFKGYDPDASVRDNYILVNKLTLTF